MTLTYSMVLNRLDVVNEREKQVRKFYKPLAQQQAAIKRPWPRRHRFADVMEPGDVIRTISKSGDDWDGDAEFSDQGKGPENSNVSQSWNAAALEGTDAREHTAHSDASLAQARLKAPSRENQPLLGYVSKVERKLKKSIEIDVEERRKGLKAQLQREIKPGDDGIAEAEPIEQLFKDKTPSRTALSSARRKLDMKNFVTEAASSRELAVYDVSSRVGRESREAVVHKSNVDILDLSERPDVLDNTADAVSPRWSGDDGTDDDAKPSSRRGGDDLRPFQMHSDSNAASAAAAAYGGVDHGRGGTADMDAGVGGADELVGDVASWRYKRTVVSPHDDPDRKEFYYLQLKVDPAHRAAAAAASGGTYEVCVRSTTLQSRPEMWLRGLTCDESGRLRVPRPDGSGVSSVFSPTDYLPWVTSPQQLLGHGLEIITHAGGAELSRRTVHFRLPGVDLPAELPGVWAAGSVGGDGRLRPVTAPSIPGTADAAAGRGGAGGSPTGDAAQRPGRASPGKPGGGSASAEPGASGGDGGGTTVSPSTAKRQELSRMRAQMRASLQQTQTAVLNSLTASAGRPRGASAAGSVADSAPGAAGAIAAPMTITTIARPSSRGAA